MHSLEGDYYAECNKIFRLATNQNERMLAEMRARYGDRRGLSLLSVGSGVGLFEIPLLQELPIAVSEFVGLDISAYACSVLDAQLRTEFGTALQFEVVNQAFQDYGTDRRFDIVLFNHSFEYMGGERLACLNKARGLLAEGGRLLFFGPNKGGLNKIYQEQHDPFFTEDLEQLLEQERLSYSSTVIEAECDISLLDRPDGDPARLCLLSFLTQVDCRQLGSEETRTFAQYFRSLRASGSSAIPHPATLIVV